MKKHIYIILGLLALSACDISKEHWPEHAPSQSQKNLGLSNAFQYRKQGLNADLRSQSYSSTGDYLNYGKTVFHRPSKTLELDDQGIPMVFQGGKFNYSAGTVAIAALAEHGRSLESKNDKQFFILAHKLLTLMSDDGALRYAYPYRHYTSTQAMAAGWTSGMDQGMAMSVFARAYSIDKNQKWLEAGNRALKFLQTPYPMGPMSTLKDLDPSLANRVFSWSILPNQMYSR
ncbi:hypothetical protein G7011_12100 [Pseudomonas plecoglossicida]|uniref:D-glucuronyl C5-epimerase family protein n=1 Tax=Pseudomonas plecoglossicida TaxID=70775 RepID=UPI0010DC599D|nr:D-glucuronyl C5-epimerase family protein [Pseudomonas plecoglossicida]MBA1197854.1 hypothetical protein [Pseudomonas plecoglossicida]RYZ54998.1 MAG: hypothetical protein EOP49_03885 [Sphingobacteriales bacterium]